MTKPDLRLPAESAKAIFAGLHDVLVIDAKDGYSLHPDAVRKLTNAIDDLRRTLTPVTPPVPAVGSVPSVELIYAALVDEYAPASYWVPEKQEHNTERSTLWHRAEAINDYFMAHLSAMAPEEGESLKPASDLVGEIEDALLMWVIRHNPPPSGAPNEHWQKCQGYMRDGIKDLARRLAKSPAVVKESERE